MAGRKPVNDDRKKHPITMYVSDEDRDIIDDYVNKNHASSRAWIIYRVFFSFLKGELVYKRNLVDIPEDYNTLDKELCKRIVSERKNIEILKSIENGKTIVLNNDCDAASVEKLSEILKDKKKLQYLINIINDSKYLCEVS